MVGGFGGSDLLVWQREKKERRKSGASRVDFDLIRADK